MFDPCTTETYSKWLRSLSVSGNGVVNNADRRTLGRIAARLDELVGPGFTCQRCKNVREVETDFPDNLMTPSKLRIGLGPEAEYLSVTPLMATILDRLVAGRGKIQSYETLLFHIYGTGVQRSSQSDQEPEWPLNVLRVVLCNFRKRLAKLTQNVRIETRFGQGLILISDVPEIVLEL